MPQTTAGRKVQKQLEQEYGKKGKQIYFALQVESKGGKGKHRWEDSKPGGSLAKARRTYAKDNKEKTYERMRRKVFGIKK